MNQHELLDAQIMPLKEERADELCTLARDIWHRHYPGIISEAQIEYMLEQRYRSDVVLAELERDDLWWDQIIAAGRMIGFSSYFLTDVAGDMKLDKLYIHQQFQRRGMGRRVVDRVLRVAARQGCRKLTLAVNKINCQAIAAYEKYGFRVVESVVKQIGGGYVMDDFIMSRAV